MARQIQFRMRPSESFQWGIWIDLPPKRTFNHDWDYEFRVKPKRPKGCCCGA